MKYWTIAFPGEWGQQVVETYNEDQIIKSYFIHWATNMIQSGHGDRVTREACIEDWKVVHWAMETDQFGDKV